MSDSDPISIKQRTCQQCGMLLDHAGEFHPYVFCLLRKAGRDPWDDLVWVNKQLGVDVTHWPERPPLVRDLAPLAGMEQPSDAGAVSLFPSHRCKPETTAAGSPRMTLSDAQQMCDAPSDAFSAGEWCEAANVLLQALYDNVRAEDWPE